MQCRVCGRPTESGETVCWRCAEERVTVLTPEENRSFTGVTIEQEPDDKQWSGDGRTNPRVHVRYYNFSTGSGSFWQKILVALIILGIVFFVVPAFFVIVLLACGVWFLLNFLRRL